VGKGIVCIYDDRPLSYIQPVPYGKASASSMVIVSLPRPSSSKWLPDITVFCTLD